MGNETSSPERTKKHAVFESPVIIPHPEKELDDGGVYKGGPASDRILKVSEILRRSLEMDIEENDDSGGDVILRNVTESDGDISERKSPTFRSSVTIHLTPCVKTLESTDRESTSKENTDIKTTDEQWSHCKERPDGENDQVIEQVIDNTISNECMSCEMDGSPLCNGNTSGMSENSSTDVASEVVEDEIVVVTKVAYHRGNSNIDDYIEKAKKIATKANGCPTGAPHSTDNGALHNGIDKVSDEAIDDVIESSNTVLNMSEPDSCTEKQYEKVDENVISKELTVPAECMNKEEVLIKDPEINIDTENETSNLETKILSEIIQKEEIQRQTSIEEQREKSRKKQSPLAKIGTKFNDALKTIKTKRRESMEKSKHRVSGAYAAEQDSSVRHASPTEEKSAPGFNDNLHNKGNTPHPNGISYEGATQKAYAICSEYAFVTRKPGSSGMIELSPEIVEHKESGSEFDTDSEIDTELIMKASAPETEAERRGPLYVGLIVKDAHAAEKVSVSDYSGSIEENTLQQHNESTDSNSTDRISGEIEHSNDPDGIKLDVDGDFEKVEPVQDILPQETSLNTTETKTEIKEQPIDASTPKPPTNTKVKKKNSILKYLLHSPKKDKKKNKHPQPKHTSDDFKSSRDSKGKNDEEAKEIQETKSSLMYVECRDKEQHISPETTPDTTPKQEKRSPDASDAEFEEIDLASTSESPANVVVDSNKCEEKYDKAIAEADCQTIPVEAVEEENMNLQENKTENANLEVDVTSNSDNKEAEVKETTDSIQADIKDCAILDNQVDDLQATKQENENGAIDEESIICKVKDEVSVKYNFDQSQAIVIDVTCVEDTVVDSDNMADDITRQEKRKLPDEENDSFDLPSPSEGPEDGTPASIGAKSSPTRKKKKKRVNSLSAKISDFFGVAEFKRRISTSSSKSDKSPQDERNVWSPEEKKTERKRSGSSIQDHTSSEIQDNAEIGIEIEEEIKPQCSLQAKSMPILTVENTDEKMVKNSKSEEAPQVKSRGKSKSKSPLKSSFLETFGLYTSKPKKRPNISSPIKQENRKSLFDEDIKVDVDQDLHIISLSDDEDETDAKPKKVVETLNSEEKHDGKNGHFPANNIDEGKSYETIERKEKTEVECAAECQTIISVEERNTNGTPEEHHMGVIELDLPLAHGAQEGHVLLKNQVINDVIPDGSKMSPGEYVSLKGTPESKTETEGITEYLKFDQEVSDASLKADSKNLKLTLHEKDNNKEEPESVEGSINTSSGIAKPETVAENVTNFFENSINGTQNNVLGEIEKDNIDANVNGDTVLEKTECEIDDEITTEKATSNTNVEMTVELNNTEKPEINFTGKEIHIPALVHDDKEETLRDVPVPESSSNCDEDSSNESPRRTLVVATIESAPVSQEHDLCEMKASLSPERCQDTSGDPLCNNAEYDSINMQEERTVSIENPNYCATCQVENKSPSDKVDDLHSKAHVDVNGENTDISLTLTSDCTEVRKSSNAAARSASMEELTVHSSHIYEEIEKKKPIIYRRFSDKSENRKVICTSPDPEGKKVKKKKSRSSSFSEFFRNPTKYKMPAWRNKKSKDHPKNKEGDVIIQASTSTSILYM